MNLLHAHAPRSVISVCIIYIILIETVGGYVVNRLLDIFCYMPDRARDAVLKKYLEEEPLAFIIQCRWLVGWLVHLGSHVNQTSHATGYSCNGELISADN